MALKLILGPSGAGKSEYIYDEIIRRTMEDKHENFIVLVPEQYSLEIQRKLVKKHPHGGSFQIDVIGFTRLAYRIFDELHIKPGKILEDFGKSMLIRQVAQERKNALSLYGESLSKAGFIDEVKSLMSELYQYDIPRKKLLEAIEKMQETGEDPVLIQKLQDMVQIFEAFEEKKENNFIVAEQVLEILTQKAEKSQLIRSSEIVLDGFTGFTPIQMNLISVLLRRAKNVTVLMTIDADSYEKKQVFEHELFALSKHTIQQLLLTAEKERVVVSDTLFLGRDGCKRWKSGHALAHLEKNIFRYPYQMWKGKTDALTIRYYMNPVQELTGVAEQIRGLVMQQGYRYREIAVVSGNLEETSIFADRIFPLYEIPYFIDMTRPLKNHPCVDALAHVLRIVDENFSYDSVFAFLKSGVAKEFEQDEIEMLENYVLARGRKGYRSWSQPFQNGEDTEMEELRRAVMDILQPFYQALSGGKKKVKEFAAQIFSLMERLDFEAQFENAGLYEKVHQLFEKMVEIIPDEEVDIREFEELFAVGMKDINLGMIPTKQDMLVVGDITRTRLDQIRVLFIVGVNDGVIPKRAKRSQIINDREKERLEALGLSMAPTEKINSYTEQFYLYQNMTKPTDALHLSYVSMSTGNDPMRPSYILDRINRIFPEIGRLPGKIAKERLVTKASGAEALIEGVRELLDGDRQNMQETLQLYRLYRENEQDKWIARMKQAMQYRNIPEQLSGEVAKRIRLEDMAMSVSKLEQYAQCAYAFFLKYILRLQERQLHEIDNRNVGIILHGAMERMFRFVRDEMKNQWEDVGDALRDSKTEQFVRECFEQEYAGQEIDEGQYTVLLQSLVRIAKRTMRNMQAMMLKEQYRPKYLEQSFRKKMSVGDETFYLAGTIDRGDICIDPETNRIHLRVIDYKSGNHDFDIGKLYEGLELQLAIYTGVLTEIVKERMQKKDAGENVGQVIPESMYYYHMHDPYVEADTPADAEKVREKLLAFTGAEREKNDMDMLVAYADYKAAELASRIKAGEIKKNPERDGQMTACDYCTYKNICRFDEKYGGNQYHNVAHPAKEKEELLKEMQRVCRGQNNNNR